MEKYATSRMQRKFSVSHRNVHAEELIIKQNKFEIVHLEQPKEGE